MSWELSRTTMATIGIPDLSTLSQTPQVLVQQGAGRDDKRHILLPKLIKGSTLTEAYS